MVNKNRNKVRIISGRLRGRLVDFPDVDGLRPTGDRLRETLFSWLQASLPDSRCLDMFAGSGVLGFEAASRGASEVVLLEKSQKVCASLRKSVEQLGVGNVAIYCVDATDGDAVSRIAGAAAGGGANAFDLVFLDPPFAQLLHQSAIETLTDAGLLAANALVCVESAKRDVSVNVPDHWSVEREKIAGDVRLCLYRVGR